MLPVTINGKKRYVNQFAAKRIYELEEETARMRSALLDCARKAEALKRPCGEDPESAQAARNAQYQAISTTAHIALGTIMGTNAEITGG